jgi:hypothetical protein
MVNNFGPRSYQKADKLIPYVEWNRMGDGSVEYVEEKKSNGKGADDSIIYKFGDASVNTDGSLTAGLKWAYEYFYKGNEDKTDAENP